MPPSRSRSAYAIRSGRGRHGDRALRRAQHRPPGPGQSFDKPFRYDYLGSAAYISRQSVVSAFKLNFGGFLGWWVWLFIHIGFLTGFRNRIGALLGWWFAFSRDVRRERTFTIDDMPVASGAYGELGGAAGAGPSALRSPGQPDATLQPAVDRLSPAGH